MKKVGREWSQSLRIDRVRNIGLSYLIGFLSYRDHLKRIKKGRIKMTQGNLGAIVYEDEDYIALSKNSGVLTHRMPGVRDAPIALQYLRDRVGTYLYPVHRLDRATSGINIFAKSSEACRDLQHNWTTCQRFYIALAKSDLKEAGEFNFDLKDENKIPKPSLTLYRPLWSVRQYGCFSLSLKTGRTHQIRRHFSRRVMNLVGDTRYGKAVINNEFREQYHFHRLCLHKYQLEFVHPRTGLITKIFAPIASDIQDLFEKLGPKTMTGILPFGDLEV